ncbi:MAG: SRPBCC domain-containing protein [Bryobacteraceae bacterium]|jgi:uncharacterized protein YndB with AHSA1/START domain
MTNKSVENIEITCERTIPASPDEVFDAWLDPKIPGTPFHENEKLIVNPMVDGLWYWLFRGQPHYGRFTEFRRPGRIRHTWMSRKTLGEETMVTVTFQKKGEGTLMTLVHSGFASDGMAQAHEKAWNFILGNFAEIFGSERTAGNKTVTGQSI